MEWSKIIVQLICTIIPIAVTLYLLKSQKIDQKVDRAEFDEFKKECKEEADKRENLTRDLFSDIKREFRENLRDYKENLKETEARLIERIDLKLSPLKEALEQKSHKK